MKISTLKKWNVVAGVISVGEGTPYWAPHVIMIVVLSLQLKNMIDRENVR